MALLDTLIPALVGLLTGQVTHLARRREKRDDSTAATSVADATGRHEVAKAEVARDTEMSRDLLDRMERLDREHRQERDACTARLDALRVEVNELRERTVRAEARADAAEARADAAERRAAELVARFGHRAADGAGADGSG